MYGFLIRERHKQATCCLLPFTVDSHNNTIAICEFFKKKFFLRSEKKAWNEK